MPGLTEKGTKTNNGVSLLSFQVSPLVPHAQEGSHLLFPHSIVLLESLSPLNVKLHDAPREIIGAGSPDSRIWMLNGDHHFLYEGPPIYLERVARGFLDELLIVRALDEVVPSRPPGNWFLCAGGW